MKKIVRKKARKLASNGHHPLRKPTKAKKHRSVSNKVKTKTLTHHEAKKLIGIKRRENRPIREFRVGDKITAKENASFFLKEKDDPKGLLVKPDTVYRVIYDDETEIRIVADIDDGKYPLIFFRGWFGQKPTRYYVENDFDLVR